MRMFVLTATLVIISSFLVCGTAAEESEVDCEYVWVDDPRQVCDGGVRTELLFVITRAEGGGDACPADESRDKTCEEVPCPVDCVFVWVTDPRIDCSVPCGGGQRPQIPFIITQAQGSGTPCPGEEVKQVTCNETPCPGCNPDPCLNDAECVESDFDYSCICLAGFTGRHCETNINECDGEPCANGGTCVDHVNFYTCNCAPGFVGDNCRDVDCVWEWIDDPESECSAPCGTGFRHQIADITTEAEGGGIPCPTEPRQRPCNEQPCPDCTPNPCLNDAECLESDFDYSCNCVEGFAGRHCETNIDDCADNPCANGGTCMDLVNDYTCNCASGFSGENCQDVDCMWKWVDNPASECSVTCGGGVREQMLIVVTEPVGDGTPCPTEAPEVPCNEQPCPVDCVSDYVPDPSGCSVDCGVGVKRENLVITTEPMHGGNPCPTETTIEIPCDAGECPSCDPPCPNCWVLNHDQFTSGATGGHVVWLVADDLGQPPEDALAVSDKVIKFPSSSRWLFILPDNPGCLGRISLEANCYKDVQIFFTEAGFLELEDAYFGGPSVSDDTADDFHTITWSNGEASACFSDVIGFLISVSVNTEDAACEGRVRFRNIQAWACEY